MKQVSILNGIAFAIVISLISALLIHLLPLILTTSSSYGLTIAVLSLAYLFYMFRYSEVRRGRVIALMLWMGINVAGWFFALNLINLLALNLLMIWLVRSLYFHASISAAIFDLLLVALSTGAGTWALLQTSSPVAATWCFFLCQSLFSAIPQSSAPRNRNSMDSIDADRFEAAHRVAQDAVRKLSLN